MKVYIVHWYDRSTDRDHFEGAFSTREGAERFVGVQKDFEIEECLVDEKIPPDKRFDLGQDEPTMTVEELRAEATRHGMYLS